MRQYTKQYIAEHLGENYSKRTGTIVYTSLKDGHQIPLNVAEELDRLCKFDIRYEISGNIYRIRD